LTEPIAFSLADAASAVAGSGLLAGLGEDLVGQLLARAKPVRLAAGEVLFRQGDAGDCAYLVQDGSLEVAAEIGSGRVRLAVLGAHQLVGEIAVFGKQPRSATVTALTPVALLRLDRADVLAAIADNPPLGAVILADLGRRLAAANQPLAFLSLAAQALEQGRFDDGLLTDLRRDADRLGPFAAAFERMVHEIEAKHARQQDMAMAARIQQSVLPRPFGEGAASAGFAVAAVMRPCREVGGDLYDHFLVDDDHLAFVIADVSGKGVPAALFMMMFHTVVKAVATAGLEVDQALSRANRLLGEDNDACMFVTAFYGVLDLRTGAVTYVNAGHNAPFRLSAGQRVDRLPGHGVAVAMVESLSYRAETVTLDPGDTLFLFTDGITEAFSVDDELFGEERLGLLLAGLCGSPPQTLVDEVTAAVDRFAAGREQSDDLSCLALTYWGRENPMVKTLRSPSRR
jgi:serine phosphatase RsbU (regulator of sigma subunit)